MGTNTGQNGSGVGTRFAALKQAFECALGAAFTEVSPEVRTRAHGEAAEARVPSNHDSFRSRSFWTAKRDVLTQEFAAYFPTLPDPQWAAAYDLYRQVSTCN